jgi:hypothetical protein
LCCQVKWLPGEMPTWREFVSYETYLRRLPGFQLLQCIAMSCDL